MLVIALLGAALWRAPLARGDVEFVFTTMDADGVGFNDPTPVEPLDDNPGTTLGEQRRHAVRYAMDLFETALDSDVPIVVSASFTDLGCQSGTAEDRTTAGSASPGVYVWYAEDDERPVGAVPNVLYPVALANHLEGVDLAESFPDIEVEFNSTLDIMSCGTSAWHYGLSGDRSLGEPLVSVALHELTHGLGFTLHVDPDSGAWSLGLPDAFAAQVWDRSFEAPLTEMTDGQRRVAIRHERQLVWTGPAVAGQVPMWLDPSPPVLTTTPDLPGLLGWVRDLSFGASPAESPIEGEVVVREGAGSCDALPDVVGRIVFARAFCQTDALAVAVEEAGGLGLLVDAFFLPSSVDDIVTSRIPVLHLTEADAQLIEEAASSDGVAVRISAAPDQYYGADSEGRIFVNATASPSIESLAHWHTSTRPALLMSALGPSSGPPNLDLTIAALVDMGWSVCGDGVLSPREACDPAAPGADAACREDCSLPRCGDGLVDAAEECDDGDDNSDVAPDACRLDCTLPRCGDGVVDDGEVCDDGDDGPGSDCSSCQFIDRDAGAPERNAAPTGDAASTPGGGTVAGEHEADGDGCGCAIVGIEASPDARSAWLAWLLGVGLAARLRRRARGRSSRVTLASGPRDAAWIAYPTEPVQALAVLPYTDAVATYPSDQPARPAKAGASRGSQSLKGDLKPSHVPVDVEAHAAVLTAMD